MYRTWQNLTRQSIYSTYMHPGNAAYKIESRLPSLVTGSSFPVFSTSMKLRAQKVSLNMQIVLVSVRYDYKNGCISCMKPTDIRHLKNDCNIHVMSMKNIVKKTRKSTGDRLLWSWSVVTLHVLCRG